MRRAARLVFAMSAGLAVLGSGAARAEEEASAGQIPGPFVCTVGESMVILSANADATRYAGELSPDSEYDGVATGEPPLVVLTQKYAGWRTVYQNGRTTMVIDGDAAVLYGSFGIIDCFASRSTSVGEGWERDEGDAEPPESEGEGGGQP